MIAQYKKANAKQNNQVLAQDNNALTLLRFFSSGACRVPSSFAFCPGQTQSQICDVWGFVFHLGQDVFPFVALSKHVFAFIALGKLVIALHQANMCLPFYTGKHVFLVFLIVVGWEEVGGDANSTLEELGGFNDTYWPYHSMGISF